MGKTTLFHPISLHVIRGAAEYCGWKFKHIHQTDAEPDRGRARYVAEVEAMPKRVLGLSQSAWQDDLQNCFMDDIRVYWPRQTKAGKWLVDLQVDLGDRSDTQDGSNRKREISL
jgi:hypothetical protein